MMWFNNLLFSLILFCVNGGTILFESDDTWNSNTQTVIGTVDLSECQDVEISFEVALGSKFGPYTTNGWIIPLWFRDTADSQRYVAFLTRRESAKVDGYYRGSFGFWYIGYAGSKAVVTFQNELQIGVRYPITMRARRSDNTYFFQANHRIVTNDDFLETDVPSNNIQMIVGPKSYTNYPPGNHQIYGMKVECLAPVTTVKCPPVPITLPPPSICTTDISLNIAFLIDDSGSVDNVEYNIMIAFIKRLINYSINDISYISLFAFSTEYSELITFTQKGSAKESIINALDGHVRVRGLTMTGSAIKSTLTHFSDVDGNNLLIIMTDGKSQDDVCDIVTSTDIGDVKILLIGIGDELNVELLSSDKYNCLYDNVNRDVFYFNEFSMELFVEKEYELRLEMCKIEICDSVTTQSSSANMPATRMMAVVDRYNKEEEFGGENNDYFLNMKLSQLQTTNNTQYLLLILSFIIIIIAINIILCLYRSLQQNKNILNNHHIYEKVNPSKSENDDV